MKLNNFFEKSKVQKKVKQVISFNNEAKENELQKTIDLLHTELKHYKGVESANDNLRHTNSTYMREKSNYIDEIDKQNTEIKDLKLIISDLEPKATAAEDAMKSSKSHQDALTQAKHDLQQVKNSRLQQDKNIDMLSKERSEYQLALKNVEKQYEIEKRAHKDVNDKYQHLQKEYKKVFGFSEENSKINIEVQKKNRDLERERNFLRDTVVGMKKQLAQKDKNTIDLENWVDSLRETILENGNKDQEFTYKKISNLIFDHYTRYKKELEKPRYMSMESIARKEGFKIPGPTAASNYNKLHLGNAKPTLLKFK